MHNGLHHVHCAEKIVSACLRVSAEKVGQGEVGGVTCRVLCTGQQVGHFTLAHRVLLLPCRGFISGREDFFGAELIFAR